LVAAAVLVAVMIFRPERVMGVVTGYVAHNICSKTFVSGLDPQRVFAETTDRAGIRRFKSLLRYTVDRSDRTVDASLAGWFGSPTCSRATSPR
jgi:hypothetical protein